MCSQPDYRISIPFGLDTDSRPSTELQTSIGDRFSWITRDWVDRNRYSGRSDDRLGMGTLVRTQRIVWYPEDDTESGYP